jgi:hypothetical protein
MDEILAKLPQWVHDIPTYLGVLVIVSTALVRLPPLKKHQEKVGKFTQAIEKVMAWLPTLGKNPHTKDLEAKVAKLDK